MHNTNGIRENGHVHVDVHRGPLPAQRHHRDGISRVSAHKLLHLVRLDRARRHDVHLAGCDDRKGSQNVSNSIFKYIFLSLKLSLSSFSAGNSTNSSVFI